VPECIDDEQLLIYTVSDPAKDDRYRTYFNLCNMTNYEIKNATLYFFVKQLTNDHSHSRREAASTAAYTVHVYKYFGHGDIDTEPVVSENRVSPFCDQLPRINIV
jgi:hypothetical protein